MDPDNEDCLIRPFFGSMSAKPVSSFFTLRNFDLHLNQMLDIALEETWLVQLVGRMGDTLAGMHWAAHLDARGVKFVLGSSTTANDPSAVLWMFDFDKVKHMSSDKAGVCQAVDAFMKNAPYYPRPRQSPPRAVQLWHSFITSYLEMAARLLVDTSQQVKDLPQLFLNLVEYMQKERWENQRGANEAP